MTSSGTVASLKPLGGAGPAKEPAPVTAPPPIWG
jgi:hypothetical protein